MKYQIEISKEARQEILALPGHIRSQARQLITELGENPFPARAKQLQGKPSIYRIWLAGNWRIAYTVDKDLQQIQILRIRPKKKSITTAYRRVSTLLG